MLNYDLNSINITDLGGWVQVGVGREPKMGYTIHCNRETDIVPSLKHRNSRSVNVRSKQLLEAV